MTFPDPELRPLLRPEELLPFIPQMGRSALYEAIARGEIPSLKIGRRIYLPTAAIRQAWSLNSDSDCAGDEGDPPETATGSGEVAA